MKKYLSFIGLVIVCMTIVSVAYLGFKQNEAVGSVTTGEGYNATSTLPGAASIRTIRTGGGMLGSVVITGTNVGTLSIYNATTSDVNKRTNNVSTSTILLADFPTNASTSTYVFDADFTAGLLVVGASVVPTGTITWK